MWFWAPQVVHDAAPGLLLHCFQEAAQHWAQQNWRREPLWACGCTWCAAVLTRKKHSTLPSKRIAYKYAATGDMVSAAQVQQSCREPLEEASQHVLLAWDAVLSGAMSLLPPLPVMPCRAPTWLARSTCCCHSQGNKVQMMMPGTGFHCLLSPVRPLPYRKTTWQA